MARVQLKHIYKRYSGNVATVKDLNLDIRDEEFLVLVGPSGCGKSTTLRMVAGLEEISEGELWIGDRLVNDVHPKDRDIAMVFQNYALYPHMNVYDNMAFGLKLRKVPKAEIDRRVREAAKILDIAHLLDRKPKALSGGQRQRVALGRAIVREPQVFLMDEPLSNLDAKLRVQMRTEISKLQQRLKTTTIYVTHDQTEAMTMGHRIVVMKDGVIQQVATPQQIYNHPANMFVASFIGSPAMNFLHGQLVEDGGKIYFRAPELNIELPEGRYKQLRDAGVVGREVVFGIRPENIHDEGFYFETFPNATIGASAEVVELMGHEMYLYLNVGGQTVTARVNTRTDVHVGSNVKLAFDMNKYHIFNKETEVAVF
jgi:multiple sugar transport system ATP-binding protein